MTRFAATTSKGQLIELSGFLSSRTYIWQHEIRERKKRLPQVYAEEVDAAVNNIISYPHMGGKKGALILSYHQIEYIGQRCYDFVKKQLKETLFEEIKLRRLEREKVEWPKPVAESYGQIWCADFTHVECYGQIIYIAVLLDDYSHYYLGYSLSNTADAALVDDAFRMALGRCQGALPEVCMINDRGSQYKADIYRAHVGDYGIEQIFIPKGTPWNNGEAEVGMKDIKALFYQRLAHTPKRRGHDNVELAGGMAQEFFKELNDSIPRPKLSGVTPADIVAGKAEVKRIRTQTFVEKRRAERATKTVVENVKQHIHKKLYLDQWSDRSVKNLAYLLTRRYNLIVPQKVSGNL